MDIADPQIAPNMYTNLDAIDGSARSVMKNDDHDMSCADSILDMEVMLRRKIYARIWRLQIQSSVSSDSKDGPTPQIGTVWVGSPQEGDTQISSDQCISYRACYFSFTPSMDYTFGRKLFSPLPKM